MSDAQNIGQEIENYMEEAKSIYPTLNEADKLTLQSQLSGLKDKHARIIGNAIFYLRIFYNMNDYTRWHKVVLYYVRIKQNAALILKNILSLCY